MYVLPITGYSIYLFLLFYSLYKYINCIDQKYFSLSTTQFAYILWYYCSCYLQMNNTDVDTFYFLFNFFLKDSSKKSFTSMYY